MWVYCDSIISTDSRLTVVFKRCHNGCTPATRRDSSEYTFLYEALKIVLNGSTKSECNRASFQEHRLRSRLEMYWVDFHTTGILTALLNERSNGGRQSFSSYGLFCNLCVWQNNTYIECPKAIETQNRWPLLCNDEFYSRCVIRLIAVNNNGALSYHRNWVTRDSSDCC